jgi:hypothetical protein
MIGHHLRGYGNLLPVFLYQRNFYTGGSSINTTDQIIYRNLLVSISAFGFTTQIFWWLIPHQAIL